MRLNIVSVRFADPFIYLSELSFTSTFAYKTFTSEGSSFIHSTPLSSTTTGLL